MNAEPSRPTRSDRARLFRERLNEAMQVQWLNRSTLAERTGVDRPTISLLLSEQQVRLPLRVMWSPNWLQRSRSRPIGCWA